MEKEDPRDKLRRLLASEEETQPDQSIPRDKPPAAVPDQTPVPDKSPVPYWPEETPKPALDKDNMPLPRRVDEIDTDATRVTPAAYKTPSGPVSPARSATSQAPTGPASGRTRMANGNGSSGGINWKRGWGCFLRGLIFFLFVGVILSLIGGSVGLYQYYSIARTLPSVEDLRGHASQFETTRILDRNGNVLYEIVDPNAGRRTYVPLSRISPNLVAATIATEDKDFYNHPGFDLFAIIRALWENYRTGGQGGGASTITQQLARNLLLSPEERVQRTYRRKAREIILAAEITRRYSKDEIIELYLNENFYGNWAYGIQAAAETYFNNTADQLTLAQSSFLAGLPQSPAVYDIYTNRDATLIRQQQVLVLMYQLSQERGGCIEVSNSETPVCVDAPDATNAANEIKAYTFDPVNIAVRYPHWVNYVRAQLEELYDPQTIYRSGFTIYTTLDPTIQDVAQEIVARQVAALADKNATNGALVAIKPSTGEILAMVGSADFYNESISGQVNMAISPTRQPGSSIKPITYVAAFEKGWTPATLIWDVPSEFPPSGNPDDPREPYKPVNYDGKFHGPMTVRTALSNSFNVPAVKTLEFVGIYDDPETPEKDGMVSMAERLGIVSFTRPDYGLSLTLGGGDVSLIEMTGAFSVFANGGQRVPPVSILRMVDHDGNVVYTYEPEPGEQVIRAEHAYLITSILSDNEARSWMFGRNSSLNLPFPAAAKTGTTNDIRDNWTIGYTPDLVTGVWVGNADYTPMVNTSGLSGAAPIWNEFMLYAAPIVSGGVTKTFVPPGGIVEKVICSLSGSEPSQWCNEQRREIFAADQPPLPPGQDLRRKALLDTWTGLEASDACKEFTDEQLVINVKDKWAKEWLKTGDGKNWLDAHGFPRDVAFTPERECQQKDPHARIEVPFKDGDTLRDYKVDVSASIDADDDIKSWVLEYGEGQDPNQWQHLADGKSAVPDMTKLVVWDLENITSQEVVLRIYVEGKNGYAERKVSLRLDLPTPTPSPTPSPTETLLPSMTPTPTPTLTLFPTLTFTPFWTPTFTPTWTNTPLATNTPVP